MSHTWYAPQPSWFRALLGAFLSPSASPVRPGAARTEVGQRGGFYPSLALHPDLASTAHLDPKHRHLLGTWNSLSCDTDRPKKVLVVPGEALQRAHRDHIHDIGLWPQGTSSLTKAIQIVERDPKQWQAVIVDLGMIEDEPGISIAMDMLRRLKPDLHFILVSRRPEPDVNVRDADVVMTWPFSLQQLEVALECRDLDCDDGYGH